MTLRITPGDGLITRTDRYLLWTADGRLDLHDLVVDADEHAFRQLGAAVLRADFDAPAFAAVDLVRGAAMVFGEATVLTEEGELDASASTTWIEQPLSTSQGVVVNPGAGDRDQGTDLRLGTVRGAGFGFGELDGSVNEPVEATPRVADGSPDGGSTPTPPIAGAASEPDFAPPPTRPADDELLVDLLDAPSPTAPHAEGPGADPFDGDLTVVAKMASSSDTLIWDAPPRAIPDLPSSFSDDDASDAGSPPVRPPGRPRLAVSEQDQDDLTPASRRRASVRFDDGQEAEVDTGIFVGRHPTKHGLPDGYAAITIRSEHVSRVHWELKVHGGDILVRDLGSSSGLVLTADGLDPLEIPRDGEVTLGGPVRLEFADRWADIDPR